ncbi:hypothetical protein E4U57_007272 [Claviceps arundinis]|uniref:Retrotransposon gag domain-containing protein n=1 Tax=Claviceps arundinis TaxID=1623583 RepID=A0A9P7SMD5_9HYPO|nr:hypothetical protein E4U57_007272 [Claviceps arundinis]KAG5956632.1 hypothetical protein E4U56_006446 [Claviceps arundinis]
MPVDPRTILAVPIYLDNKVILAMMAPLDHMAIPDTAATSGPQPQNNKTTTPLNLTTTKHLKAVLTLTTMKIEGSNGAKTRSSKHTRKRTNTQARQVNSSGHRCTTTPNVWAELFSIMLAGKALTWYMNTLDGNDLTFDDAVMAVHRTFEFRNAL